MNNKVLNFWERLRSSFWFLPSIMAIAAAVLAFALVALDAAVGDEYITSLTLLYTGGAEGTRGLLSSIASSMITVAGTTFAITVAVMVLASSNYGPRILRTFMQDTGNQIVLGTFVATFLYCLIVLRSVRDIDEMHFVPHIATTFAIVLAVANIGVLIYFIHHIAASIQVSTIIVEVRRELEESIERVFPTHIGLDMSEDETLGGTADVPDHFDRDSCPVKATKNGYIQTVDDRGILRITTKHDLVVQIFCRPGHYLVKGNTIVRAWPKERVTEEIAEEINASFTVGKQRTMVQDIEFGVLQLVEIAVRALSPSLNDPFTATMCLDQLSVVLARLAEFDFPSRYRYDEQHNLRVIADPVTFEHLVGVALDQIRNNGENSAMVLNKILHVIAVVAARVRDVQSCILLRRHVSLVERSSQRGIAEEADRQKIEERLQHTMRAISEREQQLANERQREVSSRSSAATWNLTRSAPR